MKIHKINTKINLFELQVFFVYLVFLKPNIINDIFILDFIFNMFRFGLTIIFSFLLLFRKRFSSLGWYLWLFMFAAVSFSTFLQDGQLSTVFAHYVPTLGLLAWIELNKGKLERIFKIFFCIGLFLIGINLFTVLIFPNGLLVRENASIWLLGSKQQFHNCGLSTIFFLGICGYKRMISKKTIIFSVVLIAISLFILKPIGLLLVCGVIFVLFIIERIRRKVFGITFLFFVNMVFEAGVLILSRYYDKLIGLQVFLSNIATTGLDKSKTMGHRFMMWEYGIEMFRESPWIGVGQVSEAFWFQTSGLPYYYSILHNLILDIAFTGGLLALIGFLAINIRCVCKLRKYWSDKLARFIGICFFGFNILQLVECSYTPILLLIYFIPEWLSILRNDRGQFDDKKIIEKI